jgi:folate-dependent tRNA-U54 methylase TrmFO/GidA
MNINFGLMPEINNNKKLEGKKIKYLKGREKKRIQALQSLNSFSEWVHKVRN